MVVVVGLKRGVESENTPAVTRLTVRLIRALLWLERIALRKVKPSRGSKRRASRMFPGLQKDNAGVWRGKASQRGKAMNVSVDFQGNVVAN